MQEELDMLCDGITSGNDAYIKVFGKEHPGRVRGMGFGVCPTQVLGSSSSSTASIPNADLNQLRLELQQSNDRVRALEEQVAMLMQNYHPNSRANQVNYSCKVGV